MIDLGRQQSRPDFDGRVSERNRQSWSSEHERDESLAAGSRCQRVAVRRRLRSPQVYMVNRPAHYRCGEPNPHSSASEAPAQMTDSARGQLPGNSTATSRRGTTKHAVFTRGHVVAASFALPPLGGSARADVTASVRRFRSDCGNAGSDKTTLHASQHLVAL